MWKTEKEIILVLKAHYMGRMIANKGKNIHSIIDSVNFAINELDHRNEKKDKIRQIFYIFLKIEIIQDSQDIIDLRKRAKEISEEIDSKLFNYFMAIQESTSSKNVINSSFNSGIISNKKGEIGFTVDSKTTNNFAENTFYDPEKSALYGPVADALGLGGWEISDKEYNFLINTKLHEMLENHGLIPEK